MCLKFFFLCNDMRVFSLTYILFTDSQTPDTFTVISHTRWAFLKLHQYIQQAVDNALGEPVSSARLAVFFLVNEIQLIRISSYLFQHINALSP